MAYSLQVVDQHNAGLLFGDDIGKLSSGIFGPGGDGQFSCGHVFRRRMVTFCLAW